MESQNSKKEIEHLGRIVGIETDKITVSIVSQSACISCVSKGSCSVGDVEDKIVEIENQHDKEYKINELVTVVLNTSMGAKAVLLGYFFPFLVLMVTVIIFLAIGFSEGFAGVAALLMLVPYYLILYLTRRKQKKSFGFRLK